MTRFRYYLRVRYIECDAQRVVFNSRCAEYVDVGVNEFLRAAGVLDQFTAGHLDFQLVKQTIEWKSPARYDQVLELSFGASRLGNTSFTIATDFRVAGDERVIAAAETVYVLMHGQTLTKLPLPPDIRNALERGASGRITDHAAYAGPNASRPSDCCSAARRRATPSPSSRPTRPIPR